MIKIYSILFESTVNISEEITDAQREQMKRLKPDDRITVFHGTPLFRLPHLINGFDSTQEHKRDYRGGAHRGLFVTLDWEMAKRFGGGAILELEVKAKNIHGTDYGGNIGREQEMSDKTEEFIKSEHPESFRPYLNYTMLQKGEPQGLLIGVVGPNQIKRVWVREGNELYFTFLFEIKEASNRAAGKTVGLDRGIINTIATSEGELYSGKSLRKNKRKHLYLKRKLQAKGTRSAKRLLKALSGKEKRFSNNFLHCLAKKLANDPDVSIYVLENLTKIKSKKYNKKSNKVVSNWGFKQFEMLLKYKAEASGVKINFVDARFTSQICSCCGMIDKQARNKGLYNCSRCKLLINSDINAAINIRDRYISEQLFPNKTLEQGEVKHPDVNWATDLQAHRLVL